jgi:hypothetical protein
MMEELREKSETLTAGMAAREAEIGELMAAKEVRLSAEFKALEARVAQLSKELVKETSACQHQVCGECGGEWEADRGSAQG